MIRIILIAIISIAAYSCGNKSDEGYCVVCTIDAGMKADSVSIYEYCQEYGAARLLCTQSIATGGASLTLKGYTDRPSTAFVQVGNSVYKHCVFFILENGKTEVNIGNGFLHISGTKLNKEYFKVFAERWNIKNERKKLRQKYNALMARGEITDSIDNRFEMADKQWCDSLQRLYARSMQLNPVVAQTVWSQFGNEMNINETIKGKMKPDSILNKFVVE